MHVAKEPRYASAEAILLNVICIQSHEIPLCKFPYRIYSVVPVLLQFQINGTGCTAHWKQQKHKRSNRSKQTHIWIQEIWMKFEICTLSQSVPWCESVQCALHITRSKWIILAFNLLMCSLLDMASASFTFGQVKEFDSWSEWPVKMWFGIMENFTRTSFSHNSNKLSFVKRRHKIHVSKLTKTIFYDPL